MPVIGVVVAERLEGHGVPLLKWGGGRGLKNRRGSEKVMSAAGEQSVVLHSSVGEEPNSDAKRRRLRERGRERVVMRRGPRKTQMRRKRGWRIHYNILFNESLERRRSKRGLD